MSCQQGPLPPGTEQCLGRGPHRVSQHWGGLGSAGRLDWVGTGYWRQCWNGLDAWWQEPFWEGSCPPCPHLPSARLGRLPSGRGLVPTLGRVPPFPLRPRALNRGVGWGTNASRRHGSRWAEKCSWWTLVTRVPSLGAGGPSWQWAFVLLHAPSSLEAVTDDKRRLLPHSEHPYPQAQPCSATPARPRRATMTACTCGTALAPRPTAGPSASVSGPAIPHSCQIPSGLGGALPCLLPFPSTPCTSPPPC